MGEGVAPFPLVRGGRMKGESPTGGGMAPEIGFDPALNAGIMALLFGRGRRGTRRLPLPFSIRTRSKQ